MRTHELITGLCLAAAPLVAQQAPYTLDRAVREASERYPAIAVSEEQAAAAAADIRLARTAYLPRLDFLGQANRATRNNVFGMLFPQSIIPSISGPVLGTNTSGTAWGSAVGFLVAWEPFDFGLRAATVAERESARHRAESVTTRTRFETAAQTADAFIAALAAQQTAVAAQAGVDRSRVLLDIATALVNSQLRPGADLSRARAELAVSENQLIQAQQAVEIARASLGRFLPAAPQSLAAGPLLGLPPAETPAAAAVEHPRLIEQRAAIEDVQAGERVLDRSWYPRFNLQAATYARGTGALMNGSLAGGLNGLGPNIYNWGLGLTVFFPAFELPALRARRDAEAHLERSERARYQQIRQDLRAETEAAQAQLAGARRIAQNTPVQLEAARAADQQATARYRAGLGTLVEVAEAQRLVTQAEADNALAALAVWRARLRIAIAQGDLEPFLKEAGR